MFKNNSNSIKKEVKKVIETLKFIAEKVIADGVMGIANFSKEFFGEKVYTKMSKKGYLDPYGMIDFNNKKSF